MRSVLRECKQIVEKALGQIDGVTAIAISIENHKQVIQLKR